jgi:hypothetical protein
VTRPLRIAASPVSDPNGEALRSLARALLPYLREELARDRSEGELLDVLEHVPGSQRSLMTACRTGEIAGAKKVARRWIATRAAIDAYLRTRGPRVVDRDDGDELDDLRTRIARGGR